MPLGLGLNFYRPSTGPAIPQTGLTLWLNGRNGIHLTSGAVSQWDDQSGNGNNFVQSAFPADRPMPGTGINGFTTVDFLKANTTFMTAANTWSSFITSSAWTMFAVWKYTGADTVSTDPRNYPSLLTTDDSTPSPIVAIGAGLNGVQVSAETTIVDGIGAKNAQSLTFPKNNPHYSTYQLSGGNLTSSIDSTTTSTTAVGTITLDALPVLLGGNTVSTSAFWNGSIGEIIVYNRALSPSEITAVEHFLQITWGLPITAAIPLQGLTLWLNGRNGLPSSGSVTTWADQSGAGNDFTVGTAPTIGSGINSLKTVDFTTSQNLFGPGGTSLATFVSPSAWTAFSVHRMTNAGANYNGSFSSPAVIRDTSEFWGILCGPTGGASPENTASYQWDGSDRQIADTPSTPGFPVSVYAAHRYNGSILFLRLLTNSVQTFPGSIGSISSLTAPMQICASNFAGSIGEIIIYNRALSDPEVDAVRSFLATTWGL